jgi:hypothetical protein
MCWSALKCALLHVLWIYMYNNSPPVVLAWRSMSYRSGHGPSRCSTLSHMSYVHSCISRYYM